MDQGTSTVQAVNLGERGSLGRRFATTPRRVAWLGLVALCAVMPWLRADAEDAGIHIHAVEQAVTILVAPVTERRVVRNDEGGYDVWLFGGSSWPKVRERIEGAVEVKLTLPGGWRIAKATWFEADLAYWLELVNVENADHEPIRARVTRDLESVLVEVRDCGVAKDAGRWAPPFAPMPVNLLHGPIR
jgi:hypothetical protein